MLRFRPARRVGKASIHFDPQRILKPNTIAMKLAFFGASIHFDPQRILKHVNLLTDKDYEISFNPLRSAEDIETQFHLAVYVLLACFNPLRSAEDIETSGCKTWCGRPTAASIHFDPQRILKHVAMTPRGETYQASIHFDPQRILKRLGAGWELCPT